MAKLIDDDLLKILTEYRYTHNIPEKVVIPDGDNKLFLDLTNLLSIHILLNIGIKRNGLVVEEFLFDEGKAIVSDKEGFFCNEFIFSFYKQ